jgi:hypothetical protein
MHHEHSKCTQRQDSWSESANKNIFHGGTNNGEEKSKKESQKESNQEEKSKEEEKITNPLI